MLELSGDKKEFLFGFGTVDIIWRTMQSLDGFKASSIFPCCSSHRGENGIKELPARTIRGKIT